MTTPDYWALMDKQREALHDANTMANRYREALSKILEITDQPPYRGMISDIEYAALHAFRPHYVRDPHA
jgi:hypothetical protein